MTIMSSLDTSISSTSRSITLINNDGTKDDGGNIVMNTNVVVSTLGRI